MPTSRTANTVADARIAYLTTATTIITTSIVATARITTEIIRASATCVRRSIAGHRSIRKRSKTRLRPDLRPIISADLTLTFVTPATLTIALIKHIFSKL